MSALIETPNPFSPRSEIMAFLKRSEGDTNSARQEAAVSARQMLAEKDARETTKQNGANLAWTITVPSPYAPRSKLAAFLTSMATHPERDDPDIKRAVERVRGYLAEADQSGMDSTTIVSPATQSTPGWFGG